MKEELQIQSNQATKKLKNKILNRLCLKIKRNQVIKVFK